VRERLKLFGPGGGFVFNAVHNIQPQVLVANVLAMYETALTCGRYPL
jgi:uroporphyrinogen decarboxylase